MANLTREQRAERDAQRARDLDQAKQTDEFAAGSSLAVQQQVDRQNEVDERPENWRGTIKNLETGEAYPDEREPPPDLGAAANQMSGRVHILPNYEPQPYLKRSQAPVPDLHGRPEGEGDEVQIVRKYQPDHGQGENQGIPYLPGQVVRLRSDEAKRLANLGVVKFTEG